MLIVHYFLCSSSRMLRGDLKKRRISASNATILRIHDVYHPQSVLKCFLQLFSLEKRTLVLNWLQKDFFLFFGNFARKR